MLLNAIDYALAAALMALGYRWLRNGCFDKFFPSWLSWLPGNTLSRIGWDTTYVLGFIAITHDARLALLFWLFAVQQVSIRVPHGYIMDLGQRKAFEAKWPSFFLPTFTQAQWEGMTESQRAAWDGVQGACVGLVRGIISFAPVLFYGYSFASFFSAVAVVTAFTPIAYYVARFFPWNLWCVEARTTEWAEVLHGPLVWGLAFLMIG